MPSKDTTPLSLYGNDREYLREQERTNELLADIAGETYESPGNIPNGKYILQKRMLDAAQKKNELLESIAGSGGGGGAAKGIDIDYGTDVISLKNKDGDVIAGSGATLPAYGVSFDPTTGGLTLTKNGTAMQGQTVTIPNYGSPVGVTSASDMTDHDTIYLYEGTTGGGYTQGHFYYWDGTAWADGGEYAAATVQTDKTLLVENRAADAKATGEAVGELKTQIMGFYENLTPTFEQGTINSIYGTFTNNANRIATQLYYDVQANAIFNISSEFDYSLFFYKNPVEQALSNFISTTSWLNGNNILGNTISIPDGAKLYRLAVKYHSGNAVPIEPENFTNTDYEIKVKTNDAANSDFLSFCPAITFLCRDGMALDQVPPNSKYAIKTTAENQYDMIRFSVNKTTDNYYVCVHDAIINNLAVNTDGTAISGNVYVKQSTLAELNGYDWGLKYGAEYKGLKVPQLETCIKYATMYNLSVALDIKFSSTVTDEDVEAISALLAKYAQLDAIFFAIPITTMQKFYAKSKKFSYLFACTEEQATSQAGSLKLLHSAYNKIYLAYRPMGTAPTDSFITLAMNNDFDIMYSPIEGISELTKLGFNKGVSLMECHYIPKIKKTIREYANGLI